MSATFDKYSAYYDLLYGDKNYGEEVEYLHDLLTRYGVSGPSLLEFGSGTGIHGKLLCDLGYTVHGIELSEQMVAMAGTADGFSCEQGDIRSVSLDRRFDAVISMFHVMSYQVSNGDIQAALASAAAHLEPGGLFVFDFWYTPAVYALRPETRVKRMSDDDLKVVRIAEPVIKSGENRVDVNYSIFVEHRATGEWQTFDEVHPMRHFSLPEIQWLAGAAGFEFLGAEAFLTGELPSEESWGVCAILRRKKG